MAMTFSFMKVPQESHPTNGNSLDSLILIQLVGRYDGVITADDFQENYVTTIGVDFRFRTL